MGKKRSLHSILRKPVNHYYYLQIIRIMSFKQNHFEKLNFSTSFYPFNTDLALDVKLKLIKVCSIPTACVYIILYEKKNYIIIWMIIQQSVVSHAWIREDALVLIDAPASTVTLEENVRRTTGQGLVTLKSKMASVLSIFRVLYARDRCAALLSAKAGVIHANDVLRGSTVRLDISRRIKGHAWVSIVHLLLNRN